MLCLSVQILDVAFRDGNISTNYKDCVTDPFVNGAHPVC